MKQIKSVNSKITATIALACLFFGSTVAAQTQQGKSNEMIGLSSGAIVGTAIAGPLGGIIAGVFAVMIAQDINSDKKLALANKSLQQKDQQLLVLQQHFEQSKKTAMPRIASTGNALAQATFTHQPVEIESHIQFKTGSYVLQPHYQSQLNLIAHTLQQNPKLSITLSGFADKRGNSNFNQALSEQRALSVKEYLLQNNVSQQQIITESFGESSLISAGINFEDDFFDRRVMLKVSAEQLELTAAKLKLLD